MDKAVIFLVLFFVSCNIEIITSWKISTLGFMRAEHAAFTSVIERDGKYDLTISSFSASLGGDDIFVVRDLEAQLRDNGADGFVPEVLSSGHPWPNEVNKVPENVLNRNDLWWTATGFLLPRKNDGYLAFIQEHSDASTPFYDFTSVPLDTERWFYHNVHFVDVDNDGLLDALTSRAYVPFGSLDGNITSQMVWFKQPALGDPLVVPWPVNILFEGPDFQTRYYEVPLDNGLTRHVLFSTQYFNEKLVMSWNDGATPDLYNLNHMVLDATPGERYFDCNLYDMNADGRLELLVTANSDHNGKLLIYEPPRSEAWDGVAWTKHVIADGFIPSMEDIEQGNGSPGLAIPIYPVIPADRKKPMILMTGDDDSNVYLFEATRDNDPYDWNYTKSTIFSSPKGSTVGAMSAKDIDGDGALEIFIPAYSEGKLYILKYEP